MHKVLPIVTKLMRATEISDDDAAVIKKIKQKMLAKMSKRTQSEDISLIACLLNPRLCTRRERKGTCSPERIGMWNYHC